MINQGRNQRQNDVWDGNDRRNMDNDRRHELSQPTYFEQAILQHLQAQQTPVQPVVPQVENIAQTQLTVQQMVGIVIVLGSVAISGFSAWSALNRDLDSQKSTFVAFKDSISKDVDGLGKDIIEIKHLTSELKTDNQKTVDTLDKRIQDLDTTVTQIYQKVSQK